MLSATAGTRGPERSTIASTRRLLGVDAARAVALIGMMSTHLEPKIGPDGGVSTAHLLAAGRASALFALLAGVGIALASGGTTPPRGRAWAGSAAATAARAGVIFAVGLLLGAFDSGLAVILCYYGALPRGPAAPLAPGRLAPGARRCLDGGRACPQPMVAAR